MFDIVGEKMAWVKKIYVHHDCHGIKKDGKRGSLLFEDYFCCRVDFE